MTLRYGLSDGRSSSMRSRISRSRSARAGRLLPHPSRLRHQGESGGRLARPTGLFETPPLDAMAHLSLLPRRTAFTGGGASRRAGAQAQAGALLFPPARYGAFEKRRRHLPSLRTTISRSARSSPCSCVPFVGGDAFVGAWAPRHRPQSMIARSSGSSFTAFNAAGHTKAHYLARDSRFADLKTPGHDDSTPSSPRLAPGGGPAASPGRTAGRSDDASPRASPARC